MPCGYENSPDYGGPSDQPAPDCYCVGVCRARRPDVSRFAPVQALHIKEGKAAIACGLRRAFNALRAACAASNASRWSASREAASSSWQILRRRIGSAGMGQSYADRVAAILARGLGPGISFSYQRGLSAQYGTGVPETNTPAPLASIDHRCQQATEPRNHRAETMRRPHALRR